MYPQLFWGVLALLQTVHQPLFALALQAFTALLGSLQLWSLPCQQLLQVSAPTAQPGDPPPAGVPFMPRTAKVAFHASKKAGACNASHCAVRPVLQHRLKAGERLCCRTVARALKKADCGT